MNEKTQEKAATPARAAPKYSWFVLHDQVSVFQPSVQMAYVTVWWNEEDGDWASDVHQVLGIRVDVSRKYVKRGADQRAQSASPTWLHANGWDLDSYEGSYVDQDALILIEDGICTIQEAKDAFFGSNEFGKLVLRPWDAPEGDGWLKDAIELLKKDHKWYADQQKSKQQNPG